MFENLTKEELALFSKLAIKGAIYLIVGGALFFITTKFLEFTSLSTFVFLIVSIIFLARGGLLIVPAATMLFISVITNAIHDVDGFLKKTTSQKAVSLAILIILFIFWYVHDVQGGMPQTENFRALCGYIAVFVVYLAIENAIWRFGEFIAERVKRRS